MEERTITTEDKEKDVSGKQQYNIHKVRCPKRHMSQKCCNTVTFHR